MSGKKYIFLKFSHQKVKLEIAKLSLFTVEIIFVHCVQ